MEIRYIGDKEGVPVPESDIASEIWARAMELHPRLSTAEQRAALDKHLRRALRAIDDADIRSHAESIIRQHRQTALGKHIVDTRIRDRDEAIAELFRRVEALESPHNHPTRAPKPPQPPDNHDGNNGR